AEIALDLINQKYHDRSPENIGDIPSEVIEREANKIAEYWDKITHPNVRATFSNDWDGHIRHQHEEAKRKLILQIEALINEKNAKEARQQQVVLEEQTQATKQPVNPQPTPPQDMSLARTSEQSSKTTQSETASSKPALEIAPTTVEQPAPQLTSEKKEDSVAADSYNESDRIVAIAIQELLKQKYGKANIKFTYSGSQGAGDDEAGYNYNIEIYEVMEENSSKSEFIAINDKGVILNNKLYASQDGLKEAIKDYEKQIIKVAAEPRSEKKSWIKSVLANLAVSVKKAILPIIGIVTFGVSIILLVLGVGNNRSQAPPQITTPSAQTTAEIPEVKPLPVPPIFIIKDSLSQTVGTMLEFTVGDLAKKISEYYTAGDFYIPSDSDLSYLNKEFIKLYKQLGYQEEEAKELAKEQIRHLENTLNEHPQKVLVAKEMLKVLDEAMEALGYKPKVTSAYRSYLSQVILALEESFDAAINEDWDQHSKGAIDITLGSNSREALGKAYKVFDAILGNQGTIIVYGDGHIHIYPLGEKIRMEIGTEGIIPQEEQSIYPFTAFKHISQPFKFDGVIAQNYYADLQGNGKLEPVNLKKEPYWTFNIAKGRVFPESWTTRTDEGRRVLKPNYARLLHVVQEALRFNAKDLVSYEEIPSLMAIIDWIKVYETQYGHFGIDDLLDLMGQMSVSYLPHGLEEMLPEKPATTGGSYEMAYKTAVRLLKDRKQTPDSIWNEIFKGVSRDISDKELLDIVQGLFVLPNGAEAVGLPKIAEAVFAPDGQKALLCDWLITVYILNNVEALKGFCGRIGLDWGGLNDNAVRVFAVSTNLGWDSIFREGLKRNLKELQDIAKGDYSLEIKAEAARIAEKLYRKLNGNISKFNAKAVEGFFKSLDGQKMISLLMLSGKPFHLSGGTRNINMVKDINGLGFRVDSTKLRSDIIQLLFQAETKEEIGGILDIISSIDKGAWPEEIIDDSSSSSLGESIVSRIQRTTSSPHSVDLNVLSWLKSLEDGTRGIEALNDILKLKPELKPVKDAFDFFSKIFPNHVEVILVAGALRNIILGEKVKDVDFLFRFPGASDEEAIDKAIAIFNELSRILNGSEYNVRAPRVLSINDLLLDYLGIMTEDNRILRFESDSSGSLKISRIQAVPSINQLKLFYLNGKLKFIPHPDAVRDIMNGEIGIVEGNINEIDHVRLLGIITLKNKFGFEFTKEAEKVLKYFSQNPRWHSYSGEDELGRAPSFLKSGNSELLQELWNLSLLDFPGYTRDLLSLDELLVKAYRDSIDPEQVTRNLEKAGFVGALKDFVNFKGLENQAKALQTSNSSKNSSNNTQTPLPLGLPNASGASSSLGGNGGRRGPSVVGSLVGITSSSISAAGGVNTTMEGLAASIYTGSLKGAGGRGMAAVSSALTSRL
ncbi:MAG TPA: hypothetical protein DCL49_03190, partial [Candidatus Omnitrophica bacterium]|nr:hypothetical protein [Candidatus Omnitrophota bacterium]